MLYRLQVMADSLDPQGKTFQARGGNPELSPEEAERIAAELEAGAVVRFYRGGPPQGRIVTARATEDGLWLKIRIRPNHADHWKIVESGAVNTVEIQPLPKGVDVFLKSQAATYPSMMS